MSSHLLSSDAKGKDTALFDRTLVAPNAKPWHALNREQVRYRATTVPAVLLSKGERQAAARDPGLEWDEDKRTYRPRRKALLHHRRGEGAPKVSARPASIPALANGVTSNTQIAQELSDD